MSYPTTVSSCQQACAPTLGGSRPVWGVLYEIGDDELTAVDRKEGYDWAYTRTTVMVRLEPQGLERTAVTYTVRAKESTEVPPSRRYLDRLIAAARERELPGPYVAQLRALTTG